METPHDLTEIKNYSIFKHKTTCVNTSLNYGIKLGVSDCTQAASVVRLTVRYI